MIESTRRVSSSSLQLEQRRRAPPGAVVLIFPAVRTKKEGTSWSSGPHQAGMQRAGIWLPSVKPDAMLYMRSHLHL